MTLDEKEREIFLYNMHVLKRTYKTNKEFFNSIGIDESLFTLWNYGRRKPRVNTVIKICKNLNIDLEDIISKKIKIRIICEFEED